MSSAFNRKSSGHSADCSRYLLRMEGAVSSNLAVDASFDTSRLRKCSPNKNATKSSTKLTGVTPDFFTIFNLDIEEGEMFNNEQLREGKAVCIIGPTIKSKFFSTENPIGKDIKCGQIWFRVIGVLKKRDVNQGSIENLGISDYNNSIYTPIQSLLRRVKDRTLVTSASLKGGTVYSDGWSTMYMDRSASRVTMTWPATMEKAPKMALC